MSLVANVGSDRSWLYHVAADYAEPEPRPELFAIRFANSENAQKFKKKFEECQKVNQAIADDKPVPELEILPEKDVEAGKEAPAAAAEPTAAN